MWWRLTVGNRSSSRRLTESRVRAGSDCLLAFLDRSDSGAEPTLNGISLPVTELDVSTAFYKALGFIRDRNSAVRTAPRWSGARRSASCWSKWRTFTQRPIPPAGSCGMMLSLALESRAAVDAMNEAAAAHGGQADVNPMEDHGFMYTCDLADPDGHMWAALWMDPAAMPAAAS